LYYARYDGSEGGKREKTIQVNFLRVSLCWKERGKGHRKRGGEEKGDLLYDKKKKGGGEQGRTVPFIYSLNLLRGKGGDF